LKLAFLAGANSIHSQRWVTYFAERGHHVHWFSLGIGINSRLNNIGKVNFYEFKKSFLRPLRPFSYGIHLRKILGEINPDILHAHQVWIDGILGAFSGFHPLIITPWGSDVLILPSLGMEKPLTKYALRTADLITCDGENTREAIIKLGALPQKIEIIRFGVDLEKFRAAPKQKSFIEKLDIGDSPVVISLRSLKPIYDIGTLIKAIPIVLKEITGVRFIIVGGGPQKEELVNLAKDLGVSGSIRFTGEIPNIEIPKYLNLADVYVSTALSESCIAASTAEAMACGLPVVVTDSGDNWKWIKSDENGYVVAKGDFESLAHRIVYLLSNPDIARRYGENNRRVIEEKNNYHLEMEKMEDIYMRLACKNQ
jgi:glycosyltransferase involved in cell wall biosynthesis